MPSTQISQSMRYTTGDRVVSGLLRGLVAGLIMLLYLLLAGALTGLKPVEVLTAFKPSLYFSAGEQAAPFQGFLLHLGISGVYGSIFGLFLGWIPRLIPQWLVGAVYGGALLILANSILLPTGGSALQVIPPVHFAIAHFIYGLVLGIRSQGQAE